MRVGSCVIMRVVNMNLASLSFRVSIPKDTSNSIHVYVRDFVVNKNLIPDWNLFQIRVTSLLFFNDFSTYTFKYVNETPHFANGLNFRHNKRRFHSSTCLKSPCTFS